MYRLLLCLTLIASTSVHASTHVEESSAGTYQTALTEEYQARSHWRQGLVDYMLGSGNDIWLSLGLGIVILDLKQREAYQDVKQQAAQHLLSRPELSPETLFFLLSACYTLSCDTEEILDHVVNSDSDNVLVWLNLMAVSESPEKPGLLRKAARASRVDVYKEESIIELSKALRQFNKLTPYPYFGDDIRDETFITTAYAMAITSGSISITEVFDACKESVQNETSLTADCLKIAQSLQNKAKNLSNRVIGYSLERSVLEEQNPSNPRIKELIRLSHADHLMFSCWIPQWTEDLESNPNLYKEELKAWFTDIAKVGELAAVRLAGIREYKSDSERFTNPAYCDEIAKMSLEEIKELRNTPYRSVRSN